MMTEAWALEGEPVDRTHAECMLATADIRRAVAHARWVVAHWTPRPCPPDNRRVSWADDHH